MLIWLNGAHGAGKTKVARAIVQRRPGAWLLDPEQIGFMLHKAWPGPMPDDFKDLPVWRRLTAALLRCAAAERPKQLVVVPMTLTDPQHFAEIVGGLREAGVTLRHFTLTAEPPVLRARLRRRLDWPKSRNWALARAEAAAAALDHAQFADHIRTDGLTVAQVADAVLARADA